MNSRYGDVSFTLPTLIGNVFNKLNTPFELKKLEDFMKRHPNLAVAKNSFYQALENINTNIRWMSQYFENIEAWLDENSKPGEFYFESLSRSYAFNFE